LSYVLRIRADAMRYLKLKIPLLVTFLVLPFLLSAKTTTPASLEPGPNDPNIAYITARLLGLYHYTQSPFDTEISEKFYDEYLDAFDPQHMYFLQSDIDEFSHYRTNLDVLTLGSHEEADVRPAFKIFTCFLERLKERQAYADQLLAHDDFKFTSNEEVPIDRKGAPYPKNLDEAKELWKQQLLYQFLQEKLGSREILPDTYTTETNLQDIAQRIKLRYDRELHTIEQWDGTDVLQVYLDSLAHAYDPHSDYMNLEHAQDFSITMSLALFGIGAELRSDDGYCEIESLVPGGPAAKSSLLKPDDKIVAVAQGKNPPVDVVDMELGKIVQLIRGPKGTEVRLTIIPADDPKSRRIVTLVRAEINLKDQQAKAELIETPDNHGNTTRIGVIDVPQFYAPVSLSGNATDATNYISVDTAELVQKLMDEKVQGIILDLRNNPGGSLEEAKQFVGLFVTNGPVVQVRAPDGHIMAEGNDDAPDLYHGPLIMLVNRFSASASEIAAAALQDYGRALIVGDTSTFGKGTVQNLTPLAPLVWPATETATNDPGDIKITIRKFYRINGASTQLKGVIPDIILPDVWSYRDDTGESSLHNALAWDTIPAADYTGMNDVQPYVTSLQKLAAAQVATNQDFTYVKQDIDELEKIQSQKTDTLNERKAWEEKESIEKEGDVRKAEIASRNLPDETIYEIALADAAKPGLPLPTKLIKPEAEASKGLKSPDATLDKSSSNFFSGSSTNVPPQNVVTNSEAVSSKMVASSESTYSSTNTWEPDPMMDETVRIMQGYIADWPSEQNAIASHE
jgi:carboxyl-terminal processing protease